MEEKAKTKTQTSAVRDALVAKDAAERAYFSLIQREIKARGVVEIKPLWEAARILPSGTYYGRFDAVRVEEMLGTTVFKFRVACDTWFKPRGTWACSLGMFRDDVDMILRYVVW